MLVGQVTVVRIDGVKGGGKYGKKASPGMQERSVSAGEGSEHGGRVEQEGLLRKRKDNRNLYVVTLYCLNLVKAQSSWL